MKSVIRGWPSIAGVLDTRWLELQVTSLADGETRLYAESQSQWVVARPRGEHIPTGVREVDVADSWPGETPFLSRRVTAPAQVHALVALFNSLGVVQPVTINCPAETVSPTVELRFRASASARAVARATVSASANYSWSASLPVAACFPVALSVGGRDWNALAGNVIAPIQHLLHIRLDRSR